MSNTCDKQYKWCTIHVTYKTCDVQYMWCTKHVMSNTCDVQCKCTDKYTIKSYKLNILWIIYCQLNNTKVYLFSNTQGTYTASSYRESAYCSINKTSLWFHTIIQRQPLSHKLSHWCSKSCTVGKGAAARRPCLARVDVTASHRPKVRLPVL